MSLNCCICGVLRRPLLWCLSWVYAFWSGLSEIGRHIAFSVIRSPIRHAFIVTKLQPGIKSDSTASKIPESSMHFHVYKNIIIIKIIVYILITFTSLESWTIYVIYIVILIGFSLCKLERQRIKFCVRHLWQFLSDVNIDVNGNLPFLKFPLHLNWEAR